jgi:hypothetical protein
VYYRCWESNPDIREWMEKQGYTEINQVEEYYMARVLSMTQDIGYKSIVWQDVWDNNVPVWMNNDFIKIQTTFSLVSNFSNFNAIIRYLEILFYKCGKTTTAKRKLNGNTICRELPKTATKQFSLLHGI